MHRFNLHIICILKCFNCQSTDSKFLRIWEKNSHSDEICINFADKAYNSSTTNNLRTRVLLTNTEFTNVLGQFLLKQQRMIFFRTYHVESDMTEINTEYYVAVFETTRLFVEIKFTELDEHLRNKEP